MPDEKLVLVTGANGFLGANVIMELQRRGIAVRAMMRRGSDMKALGGYTGETVTGNITDVSDLERALKGCSHVIHCAARTQQSPTHIYNFAEANITATALLICLSRKHNIKRFVYVSTANCFTNGTLERPGDEKGGFMPWLGRSGYAFSKFLTQEMLIEEYRKNGFPALIVAPAFMIGPRDAKPSAGRLVTYACRSRIVFYPPGGKSFVDVEYAAEAVVNALESGRAGQTYLIAGQNMSFRDFMRKIRSKYNGRKTLIPIPRFFISAVAFAGGFIEKLTGASMPLNRVNQRLLCLDNYFSGKKAEAELGLKSTDVDEALQKAIRWFGNKGYIK